MIKMRNPGMSSYPKVVLKRSILIKIAIRSPFVPFYYVYDFFFKEFAKNYCIVL